MWKSCLLLLAFLSLSWNDAGATDVTMINKTIDRYENSSTFVDCNVSGVASVAWYDEANAMVSFNITRGGDYQEFENSTCDNASCHGDANIETKVTTVRLHLRGNVTNTAAIKMYRCIEKDSNNNSDVVRSITSRVNVPVTITNKSASTITVCLGQAVTLFCQFRVQPAPLFVTWNDVEDSNWTSNGDVTTTFLTLDSAKMLHAKNYTCKAVNEDWSKERNHSITSTLQLIVLDIVKNVTFTNDDVMCSIQWEGTYTCDVIGYKIDIIYDYFYIMTYINNNNITKYEWAAPDQSTSYDINISLVMSQNIEPYVTIEKNCSKQPLTYESSDNTTFIIIAAITSLLLFLIVILNIGCFCYKRRKETSGCKEVMDEAHNPAPQEATTPLPHQLDEEKEMEDLYECLEDVTTNTRHFNDDVPSLPLPDPCLYDEVEASHKVNSLNRDEVDKCNKNVLEDLKVAINMSQAHYTNSFERNVKPPSVENSSDDLYEEEIL